MRMAKKLWEVYYDPEPLMTYCVAETKEEAEKVAAHIDWSDYGGEYKVTVSELYSKPTDSYHLDNFPEGDTECMTLREYLALTPEQIADREAAERARAEFEQHPKLLEV
jgi:hypothetical protein